ncbi:MAG: hypothetical protein KGM15_11960 [Pseudomonadota bacterium]|nr:hypothetical protein [Pseudomonadota bacterium]
MAKKKSLSVCAAQASKVENKIDSASHSAAALQSQIKFLARRGISPARAAIVAPFAFGEARS